MKASLATAAGREWRTSLASGNRTVAPGLSFGVRLIDPVDVYVLSDRASKYAMLFVLLTLASVFLFETFKRLRVHPVQYGLLGLSVVVFFLLLISLAEQIGFTSAYVAAATACCVLITFYSSHALGSWKRAVPLGGGLAMLYAILFGILKSEENALVAGSVLIFVLLAALMIATRKTDWYALTQKQ
jgi:inner membrane protein